MRLPEYFISCDWGTSNFRLRLVETSSLRVVAGHSKGEGIKPLNQKFLAQAKGDRQEFFSAYLSEQLGYLPMEYRKAIVIVSGMASSTIGMLDLPYADFPFDGSGKDLYFRSLPWRTGQKLLLVSGVKSENGMIRGEEVQAIGLEEQLRPHKKAVLLLPGTHSKHLSYEGGLFTGLKNYMSGELFDLLIKHSILANSVGEGPWTGDSENAFKEGVKLGSTQGLTAGLFGIRAMDVLQNTAKEYNYYLLSGTLIGDELGWLKQDKRKLVLAASNPLLGLYSLALSTLFSPDRWVAFDDTMLEHALLAGQQKILKEYCG